MPQRPSTSTPQTFPVATQPDRRSFPPGAPTQDEIHVRFTAAQPKSARFELVFRLRGFKTLVPHVHLSASLARPRPSGSADLSRRCQGCFPPSPASPGSGCPQLQPACCDSPAVKVSHLHRNPQRLVAHLIHIPSVPRRVSTRPRCVHEPRGERRVVGSDGRSRDLGRELAPDPGPSPRP